MNEEELVDVHEAARMLDLTVGTVYQKTSRGEIPFVKKGRKLLFSPSALRGWDEARTSRFVPDGA